MGVLDHSWALPGANDAEQSLREGRSNSRLRHLFPRPLSCTLNVCFPNRPTSALGRDQ